jgi:hypothetical protein
MCRSYQKRAISSAAQSERNYAEYCRQQNEILDRMEREQKEREEHARKEREQKRQPAEPPRPAPYVPGGYGQGRAAFLPERPDNERGCHPDQVHGRMQQQQEAKGYGSVQREPAPAPQPPQPRPYVPKGYGQGRW